MRMDQLGNEIKAGDYVGFTTATTGLNFSRVEKYTPKMIRLRCGRCIADDYLFVITEEAPRYTEIVDEVNQKVKERDDLIARYRK